MSKEINIFSSGEQHFYEQMSLNKNITKLKTRGHKGKGNHSANQRCILKSSDKKQYQRK